MQSQTIFSDMGISDDETCSDYEKIKNITKLPTKYNEIIELLTFFDKIAYRLPLHDEIQTVYSISNILLGKSISSRWLDLRKIFEENNWKKYPGLAKYIESNAELAKAAQDNPDIIKYIDNPNSKVQQIIVRQRPDYIQYINKQSEKAQLLAIDHTHNYEIVQYLKKPTETVILKAVTKFPLSIQYFSDCCEAVRLEAVGGNGLAIKYIKNPSEEVQLKAVTRSIDAFRFIQSPTEAVYKYADIHYGYRDRPQNLLTWEIDNRPVRPYNRSDPIQYNDFNAYNTSINNIQNYSAYDNGLLASNW